MAVATDALLLRAVTKRFGDFVALHDVDFTVSVGQVHALLGANGSGKSTLVKVMSGVLQPDEGRVALGVDGAKGIASPAVAGEMGIRVVHQEAPLIDTMTVAEMYALFHGFDGPALGRVPWKAVRARVEEVLGRMDVGVRPDEHCGNLAPADRAGLALAITVGDLFVHEATRPDIRVLLVDEVTASIPEAEAGRHLRRIRAVADRGVGVVMVTHRLAELDVADDITVLRAGQVAHHQGSGPRRSNAQLVAEMVGEDRKAEGSSGRATRESEPVSNLWEIAPPRLTSRAVERSPEEPVLQLEEVHGSQLRGCTFTIRPGEVVGFVGLRHSGLEEIPRLLSGAEPWRAGTIRIGKRVLDPRSGPADVISAGVAVIPADRLHAGGVPSLSVDENVILPGLARYWHRTRLRRDVVGGVLNAFDVRPRDPSRIFGALSGGNQQKVLLGKWLAMRPAVLVLDDPTYGVDPAAREIIFDGMLDAAANGVAVLFLSTEPELLARVCTRVLAIHEGVITKELTGADLNLESLIEWSIT